VSSSDRPPPSRRKAQPAPLVQVEKLSKLFPVRGGLFEKPRFVHAVDGVTLYVRKGETLGLVGESGCGKSTLGRTMIRLLEPTLGRILFDGRDVTRMLDAELRATRRRMQIVFQDPYSSLNPRMTVRDIVGEGISIFNLAKSRAEADAQVSAVLAKVGLGPEVLGRYPHEFSGGQRQRIGIARALAVGPDFLVCDEPVSALDVSVQAQILNLLEGLQDELGLSMLFISHDLRVVQYVAHRTAVMYLGQIVEMGPTPAVAEKRHHPYTRALWSAMPELVGEESGKKRLVVQGEPPSALDPPKGCAFHPRCPRAEKGKCDVEAPVLEELLPGSHHRVACWHPELS
jgi:oligopeptide transport system ATP-binding protein